MLAEQQQIAPHPSARRSPLLDAFGRAAARRLGLLVPQREQLSGPGRELGCAVAPELRRGGRRTVLAIAPGVAAPNRKLRAPAPLHLAEEVLRSRRHETGIGEATGKLFDVRNHALVQEGVVARSAAEQRHIVGIGRGQEQRMGEQPVGEASAHLGRIHVESEARAVGVLPGPPVQHAAPVRSFPPVQLRVGRPIAPRDLGACGVGGREQWRRALRVDAAREIAHTARGEQGREGEWVSRHVGQLRRLVAQSMLAREQTGRPEDAREGLVVEDSRQRLCEHRGNAELAVADRPCERLTCGGGPVLDVRDQLQPALRRPAEVGMRRQPGQRCIQVPAVHFEALLVPLGEADVGVARGDPIQRPAPRRSQPDASTPDALLPHLDVDLELHRSAAVPRSPRAYRGGRSPGRALRGRRGPSRRPARGCCARRAAGTAPSASHR